ncbi:amidohydrolase [Azospirillum sp. 412522]|nr:amidohydrolase [Azospirillum sp. 412522]MBY6261699.1 amidohydrolase [Azospirillum sp. 412522]
MNSSLSNTTSLRTAILEAVEAKAPAFHDLSDRIWGYAELGYCEFKSMEAQIETLAAEGFRITRNVGGVPTAFMAEAGSGGPVVALLGEFDALAGLSQVAGATAPQAEVAEAPGHGCGHNLLGSGAALGAAALAAALSREGLPGRVRYYGCPAEEGGGGKAFMARGGAFDDVDLALTWHPAAYTGMNFANTLAFLQASVRFTGRAAHAGLSPHLGRSALDAVELMNVGVNYMREHMIPEARVHYAYRDAGGRAANVVQANAEIAYVVRAPDLNQLWQLFERVKKIAEGAALMTETTVEVRVESGMSNVLLNRTLGDALYRRMQDVGGVRFDEGDFRTAQAFMETLSAEDLRHVRNKGFGSGPAPERSLHDGVAPFDGTRTRNFGSTDVGDVSWVVPTAQFWGATCAMGTPFHSWQLVAQGKLPGAHKGMTNAASILALTALDALADPDLIAKAKEEFRTLTGGRPYQCPVPADVQPPLQAPLQATAA